jgi:hypothetical protein
MAMSPRTTRIAVAVAGVVLLALTVPACSAPTVAAACGKRLVASDAPALTDPALVELSGIAASRANAGLWWVHNDSGDSARVFAVDENGAVRTTLTLAGQTAIDIEDIALGEGPTPGATYVYVADIGDNTLIRTDVKIYRFVEPAVGATTGTISSVEMFRLRYPDGAHDAEAFFVDPLSHSLVIVTKSLAGGAQPAYRVGTDVAAGTTTTMTQIGTVTTATGPGGAITGADASPNGLQLAIRTYGGVRLIGRNADLPLGAFLAGATGSVQCPGPVPAEVQGEAVGFRTDGRGYVTVSEGTGPVIHRYNAP